MNRTDTPRERIPHRRAWSAGCAFVLAGAAGCSASAPAQTCVPPDGTYVLTYMSDSDAEACTVPPSEMLTLPFDAGSDEAEDSGVVCTAPTVANGCVETCKGTIEGFSVSATTTVMVSASGYSGENSQTTTSPDGGLVSRCSYSYSAQMSP